MAKVTVAETPPRTTPKVVLAEPTKVSRDDLGDVLREVIRWPEGAEQQARWTLGHPGQVVLYPMTNKNFRMLNVVRARLEESLSLHVRTIVSGPYRDYLAVWVSKRV